MDKIAVLIPCYNEEKTIVKVIEDWYRELPEATIYVYDNNSTDDSAKLALETGKAVIRHEHLQGKGNVIRRMFREIDALCYIMVDADDTYPAEYGRQMSEAVLNEQVDMVIGDRLSSTYYIENKRRFHNFGNSLVKRTINFLFNSDIQDIMTGYRAFSYIFVKTFPILTGGFEIETEMTMHAVDKKMCLKNVVVEYRDRPVGSESKLNTYSDGIRVLRTIIKLFKTYRPLRFFSCISFMAVFIAIIMLIPVFITYFNTNLVPRFPTLIVACFIILAAIISFFAGLILSNLADFEKREFEFKLFQVECVYKEKIEQISNSQM